jgi:hypothetical protein
MVLHAIMAAPLPPMTKYNYRMVYIYIYIYIYSVDWVNANYLSQQLFLLH